MACEHLGMSLSDAERAKPKTYLMKLFRKIVLSAAIVAFTLAPIPVRAQSSNKTHAAEKNTAEPKSTEKKAHPFRGKLAAVDKATKSITIGKSVYYITSDTRIKKDGKDATLEDASVGEQASGYAKPMEGGKMAAASLKLGEKSEEKTADKKKQKKDSGKAKEKSQ
jgi:hypothetical protein